MKKNANVPRKTRSFGKKRFLEPNFYKKNILIFLGFLGILASHPVNAFTFFVCFLVVFYPWQDFNGITLIFTGAFTGTSLVTLTSLITLVPLAQTYFLSLKKTHLFPNRAESGRNRIKN